MVSSNMDLFTRCTRCETVFRVTTGDLQASGGQVRCGRCQAVFDAFASLTAKPPSPAREDADTVQHPPETREELALLDPEPLDPEPLDLEPLDPELHEPEPLDPELHEPESLDPELHEPELHEPEQQEPGLGELEERAPTPGQATDPVNATEPEMPLASDGSNVPPAGSPGSADRFANDPATNLYEWEFKAAPKIARTRLWSSLSLLLVVLAIAQAAYVFRTQIMVNYPQVRPLYEQVCLRLSCEIGLPRLTDQLDIDASDLQLIDRQKRNEVELTALVRNRARVAVEFPAFELTLTNEKEQVVARRVFLPEEYLSDETRREEGFAGRGELAVRLFLDIGPLGAAGYRIYLFYPS